MSHSQDSKYAVHWHYYTPSSRSLDGIYKAVTKVKKVVNKEEEIARIKAELAKLDEPECMVPGFDVAKGL